MVVEPAGKGRRELSVAFIAPFPPPYGGMGVRFEQMGKCFEEVGISVERIQLEAADGMISRLFSFLRSSLKVFKLRSTLVHVVTGSIPNFIALTPVYLAAKFSGKKIVLSIGGGYWEREAHLTSLRSGVVRLLLKLPDMVIGCNVGLTDAVGSLGVVESRRTCISNALPSKQGDRDSVPIPDEFSRIRSNADKILLYVGALKPWYGLLETLDTFAELRNNGVHAALVALVKEGGDAEYLSAVFDKAKAYALSEHFHLFVSVPWAVSAMALSDVIVRATNAIEGDSRAVREALAIGVPVIASDIGYRPEGVILFKAGDARSMQKAVVKALYLSSHNVTKSDSIEGKNNIRRILEIYKKLLD